MQSLRLNLTSLFSQRTVFTSFTLCSKVSAKFPLHRVSLPYPLLKSTSVIDTLNAHQRFYANSRFSRMDQDKERESTYTRPDIKIELTKLEKDIFDLLRNVLNHFKLRTTIRVNGGWVRDKIFDIYFPSPNRGNTISPDIDIALDDKMGVEFANLINEYYKFRGQETHNVGVIAANPEQSKHLETATTKVMGVPIDFVNLRTEEYTDTRIPTMKIGTAFEDAFRRDLTMNALFYNVNLGVIEDFTQKGIQDIKDRVIRTPTTPIVTLLDDPLRVVRAIRFASRFESSLAPEIVSAARTNDVKMALLKKVSKERIGKELKGMFVGDASKAFAMILDLELFDIVFRLPEKTAIAEESTYRIQSVIRMSVANTLLKLAKPEMDSYQERIALVGAFLSPIATYTYEEKKRQKPLIKYIIIESIKWPIDDATHIEHLASCSRDMMPLLKDERFLSMSRKELGLVIRKTAQDWKIAALLSLSYMISGSSEAEFSRALEVYQRFVNKIEKEQLVDAWNLKPLINGEEVAKLLNKERGAWLSKVLELQIEWQLENPKLGITECQVYLRSIVL